MTLARRGDTIQLAMSNLKTCAACGKEMAAGARTCPHCGKTYTTIGGIFIAIIIGLIIAGVAIFR